MPTDHTVIIDYHPHMIVRNLDQLPRGTGAKYLEVIEGQYPREYIAKQWRHYRLQSPGLYIRF